MVRGGRNILHSWQCFVYKFRFLFDSKYLLSSSAHFTVGILSKQGSFSLLTKIWGIIPGFVLMHFIINKWTAMLLTMRKPINSYFSFWMRQYRRINEGANTRSVEIMQGKIDRLSMLWEINTHGGTFSCFFAARSLASRYLYDSLCNKDW